MNRIAPLLVSGLLLLFAACTSAGDGPGLKDNFAEIDTSASDHVGVEGLEYALLPGGGRVLSGRLVNPTDKHLRNAQLQIALYDEHNRSIGSMLVVVKDVPPRGERSFREGIDRDDVTGARVRAIMVQ